jgi:UDP-glucose 4-epimerase
MHMHPLRRRPERALGLQLARTPRIRNGAPETAANSAAPRLDANSARALMARAYVLAMTANVTDQAFNVGTGIETSLLELCGQLCQATGAPNLEPVFLPVRKVNPVPRRLAAVERARSSLCFEARVGLCEGLNDLVQWHAVNLQSLDNLVRP